MQHSHCTTTIREPCNKGKFVDQQPPFRLKLANRRGELAPFNLTIDSKLRACDL